MTRLAYLLGFLLALGFALSMLATVPAIKGPPMEGELWTIKPE